MGFSSASVAIFMQVMIDRTSVFYEREFLHKKPAFA
jgi:hypothetical protein